MIYKKMIIYISYIMILTSLLLLLFVMYLLYQYRGHPEDAFLFGYKPVYVKTDTMSPVIKENSICIVKRVDCGDINVGDMVLYSMNDFFVIHRVTDIVADGFQTKADMNEMKDTYLVGENQVEAKVVYVLRCVP